MIITMQLTFDYATLITVLHYGDHHEEQKTMTTPRPIHTTLLTADYTVRHKTLLSLQRKDFTNRLEGKYLRRDENLCTSFITDSFKSFGRSFDIF